MSTSRDLAIDLTDSARDVGAAVVILCDISGSMLGERINRLRDALKTLWEEMPRCRIFGFNYRVHLIESPDRIPTPSGNTALHLALEHAYSLRPAKTIVISDGHPDDAEAAINAASKIPGIIDIAFVGSDGDRPAIQFMKRLARVGGGRVVVRDIAKTKELLAPVLKDMLSLPAPISL
jgi:Mg-chelatase subunit ChlD